MTWLDIVGWAGSALLVFSLLQSRVLRFRLLNTVACGVLVFFNAMIGVWPMVAMNLVLAAINLWFIAQLLRQRHDEAAFEVLRVHTDDDYLAHVLSTHADDIHRYQPDFAGPQPDEGAFIVIKGDETVGVVVLARDGETARVRLDYVTQPKSRPPSFVLFTSRADAVPDAYRRYLVNSLRESFDLPGTPIRLTLREKKYPYDKRT